MSVNSGLPVVMNLKVWLVFRDLWMWYGHNTWQNSFEIVFIFFLLKYRLYLLLNDTTSKRELHFAFKATWKITLNKNSSNNVSEIFLCLSAFCNQRHYDNLCHGYGFFGVVSVVFQTVRNNMFRDTSIHKRSKTYQPFGNPAKPLL